MRASMVLLLVALVVGVVALVAVGRSVVELHGVGQALGT
jgi:hypothetical protein